MEQPAFQHANPQQSHTPVASTGLDALAAAASEYLPLHSRSTSQGPGATDPAASNTAQSLTNGGSEQPQSQRSSLPPQDAQIKVERELNDVPMSDAPPIMGLGISMEAPTTNGVKSPALFKSASPSKQKSLVKAKPKGPKKRPAPKKGVSATKKPAVKKRKLDTGSAVNSPHVTPIARASATPVPKGKRTLSSTPTRNSPATFGYEEDDDEDDEGEEDDDDDNDEVFCICRKPDDHGVMIGCDGPCEDWFHIKCVGMQEKKTKLVQQWFCPNCTEQGHETLWKRMCRLPGCDEPARQDDKNKTVSKYCSDEHGEQFFRQLIPNGAIKPIAPPLMNGHGASKGRTSMNSSSALLGANDVEPHVESPAATKLEDYDGGPRGGVLRGHELKTLINGVRGVSELRQLGDDVQLQNQSTSNGVPPTPLLNLVQKQSTANDPQDIDLSEEERSEYNDIMLRRDKLERHLNLLQDREAFINMVEARHKAVLAELKDYYSKEDTKTTFKDICGFDSRLIWADEEFASWRSSTEGEKAFVSNILAEPSSLSNGLHHEEAQETEEDKIGRGVCKKRRCERHRQWLKSKLVENTFEAEQDRTALWKLDIEEKELRNRAVVRLLEEGPM